MGSTTSPPHFLVTSFPRVPLTTTFTPTDPNCAGFHSKNGLLYVDDQTSCLPSGFRTAETAFFSPGIACPSGYWEACSDTTGVKSITTVTCCPYRDNITLRCVKDVASLAGPWTSQFCTFIAPQSPGITVSVTMSAESDKTSVEVMTLVSAEGINAFGVRMVRQATDMASTTASTSASSSTVSSPSSLTSGPGALTQTSPPGENATPGPTSNPGLSTGAAIAIGVVIPVLVIAALVGFFFLWRRRRDNRQDAAGYMSGSHTAIASGSQGHALPPSHDIQEHKYYYGSVPQAPQEMPSHGSEAIELPVSQNFHELSNDRRS
ncbi:hypothetical protein B0H63DRAFT_458421 [Podospora didyma]|uniref:Mid2 domain-containing protein n=1 Tax=Podospora didyma TaxID=330526 RepID=A0AAE0P594_9PEZI|nr:hypothetical protein B0H63DRAFT_458421 [Podospora didyma]